MPYANNRRNDVPIALINTLIHTYARNKKAYLPVYDCFHVLEWMYVCLYIRMQICIDVFVYVFSR